MVKDYAEKDYIERTAGVFDVLFTVCLILFCVLISFVRVP